MNFLLINEELSYLSRQAFKLLSLKEIIYLLMVLKCFKFNKNLINLRWNDLGNPGEQAIFNVLDINDKILNLDLVENNISEDFINSKLDGNDGQKTFDSHKKSNILPRNLGFLLIIDIQN